MSAFATCPECGSVLPAGTVQGLCPSCLLQVGLEQSAASGDQTFVSTPRSSGGVTQCVQYFGDYELLHEIARGGMGVVYKARQVNLNREVAVKMILAGALASEEDVQRFHAEAEAAANLDHPGIVPIYEIGEHAGQHYFSMAYVAGQSLAERLKEHGPLDPYQAAELLQSVTQAVAYAHGQGVIHRDLKPANILLQAETVDGRESRVESQTGLDDYDAGLRNQAASGSGPSALDSRPRITDFGLAKRIDVESGLTATGQVLGTPGFMSPEQAAGRTEDVGPASDVYALGAILYAMLTGRPPFLAATLVETLNQVIEQETVPPRQMNRSIPRDLETICLACLQKEPERRYQSAAELAEDLDRFLKGAPVQARAMSGLRRAFQWMRAASATRTVRYESQTKLFGLPLVSIASGPDFRKREARGHAKGIFAMGDVATGVVAVGGFARGLFAFGGLALGGFTWAGIGIGLASFSGMAVGIAAAGGFAVGYWAVGGMAVGVHAWGGQTFPL